MKAAQGAPCDADWGKRGCQSGCCRRAPPRQPPPVWGCSLAPTAVSSVARPRELLREGAPEVRAGARSWQRFLHRGRDAQHPRSPCHGHTTPPSESSLWDIGSTCVCWGPGDAPGPAAVLARVAGRVCSTAAPPPSQEGPPQPLCLRRTSKGTALPSSSQTIALGVEAGGTTRPEENPPLQLQVPSFRAARWLRGGCPDLWKHSKIHHTCLMEKACHRRPQTPTCLGSDRPVDADSPRGRRRVLDSPVGRVTKGLNIDIPFLMEVRGGLGSLDSVCTGDCLIIPRLSSPYAFTL